MHQMERSVQIGGPEWDLGYRLAKLLVDRMPSVDNQRKWKKRGVGIFLIYAAKPESLGKSHDRYAPGLHHLCFDADSRDEVDRLHGEMVAAGATVLDAPAEYQYTPGYYAVFFADPDGLKLELCFAPAAYQGVPG